MSQPVHKILVLIVYELSHYLKRHPQLSRVARCLRFSPSHSSMSQLYVCEQRRVCRGQKCFNIALIHFHSSSKHMHLCFKRVYNKEHKGVICNMTSSSNSSQSTHSVGRGLGKNYSSFLDFTHNNKLTSGIFVLWSDDTVHPCKLVRALAVCICNKYQNLMNHLKYSICGLCDKL